MAKKLNQPTNIVKHTRRSLEKPVLIWLNPSDLKKLRFIAFSNDRLVTPFVRDLVLTHIDLVLGKTNKIEIDFEEEQD